MTATHSSETSASTASSKQAELQDIGHRHGFSGPATMAMFDAVAAGSGSMAQFDHPEFGGSGQWMRGGMVMVSDLSNHGLQARVQNLCNDLAAWLADHPQVAGTTGQSQSQRQGRSHATEDSASSSASGSFAPFSGGTRWWPGDWGQPASSGAQNGMRYAWFPEARRLAIEANGRVTVHDTGKHRIEGVSQQQSSGSSLTFTSQHGAVDLSQLPVVGTEHASASGGQHGSSEDASTASLQAGNSTSNDGVATLERLAELKAKGILTDTEFAAKKTELLSRI